jgi:DNA-directed RNA polymerase specialized sigma24 family protein
VLLTGSKEAGEDLLQAGLERLLRHWSRIDGDPEGYLRRTLYNLAADGWRQQRAWQGRLRLLQSGTATSAADGTAAIDTRDALIRLLMQLASGRSSLRGRRPRRADRPGQSRPGGS